MNLLRWVAGLLACFAWTGCQSPQPCAYTVNLRANGVGPSDVAQAEAYRRILPTLLWVEPRQIRIEAGPGITYIVVSHVVAPEDLQALIADTQQFNEEHPLSPVELKLE
jgi:hypothetical protein